jgi:hypothetical protein
MDALVVLSAGPGMWKESEGERIMPFARSSGSILMMWLFKCMVSERQSYPMGAMGDRWNI